MGKIKKILEEYELALYEAWREEICSALEEKAQEEGLEALELVAFMDNDEGSFYDSFSYGVMTCGELTEESIIRDARETADNVIADYRIAQEEERENE